MQAIQTKLMTTGRIKARCAAKYIFVDYMSWRTLEENHISAAKKLICVMQLDNYGNWSTGTLADGSMVHVCNPDNKLIWQADQLVDGR